jgi:hypothetical protein
MANRKVFEVAMILSASDKASRTIDAATANARKKIAALSGMGDKAFSFGRTSGAIGLGIIAPLGLAINAAEESEIAFKRLDRTFKTMGETDSKAAVQAAEYASALQMRIGKEDEEIQMVQSKIATFKKVSDETARMSGVFDRATEAAFDLAAGGFGEASANAVQLGKALQDPAKGATALARTGALNKSDIPLIKQIQATKGLGAAQEYVLKAVERQVKGQAANTATSAAKMRVTFSEVSETLGKALLPQVQKVMASVGSVVNKFNAWAQKNPELLGGIVKVVGSLGALSLGVSVASFVFGGLFKTIALGKTIMLSFRTAQTAFAMAQLAGTGATGGMTAAVTALNLAFLANPITWVVLGVVALIGVGYLLIKNWDKVKLFFVGLWANIKIGFSKFLGFIKEWGVLLLGPIGLVIKFWDKIPLLFRAVWDKVKSIFISFSNFFGGIPMKFVQIGVSIISGLWNGMKSKALQLFNFVKNLGKSVANAFKSVLGIASPSKVFMDYGVNITEGASKGIQKGSGGLQSATKGMAKGITPSSGGRSSGGAGSISVTFAPVINGGGNTSDVLAQIKAYVPELIRQIEDNLVRKQRLSY